MIAFMGEVESVSVHRNSLGYVVGKAPRSGDGPQIVTARDAVGSRISIEDARSGGRQGLTCVCGAELIARKGPERAHHFAHASGSGEGCEAARTTAIGEFVQSAIGASGRVRLPDRGARSEEGEVRAESYSVHDGVVVVRLVHAKGVELDMAVAIRPRDRGRCRTMDWGGAGRSAMLVSLVGCQSFGDQELADAIVAGGTREWLADRKPERRWRPRVSERWGEIPPHQVAEVSKDGVGDRRKSEAEAVTENVRQAGKSFADRRTGTSADAGVITAGGWDHGKRETLGEDFPERLETMFPAAVERAYLDMKYRRNRQDRK